MQSKQDHWKKSMPNYDTDKRRDVTIPRLYKKSFQNVDFIINYFLRNEACIFNPEFTDDWLARKEWANLDGAPNLENLRSQYGIKFIDWIRKYEVFRTCNRPCTTRWRSVLPEYSIRGIYWSVLQWSTSGISCIFERLAFPKVRNIESILIFLCVSDIGTVNSYIGTVNLLI